MTRLLRPPSAIAKLVDMHDKLKIRSMGEAAAAYEHANQTMAMVVALSRGNS